ncbi:MAG TPA: hypothetical protein VGJ78_04385 [Vicinamibacterales bacterium]|jgi:hypothetical protein
MAQRVYVCLGGDYEGDWITGVFSTREASEAHLTDRAYDPAQIRPTRIEEYEVDAPVRFPVEGLM